MDEKARLVYPIIAFCPVCGDENIKHNSDVATRCRTCDVEFSITITYNPASGKRFWFDTNRQEIVLENYEDIIGDEK